MEPLTCNNALTASRPVWGSRPALAPVSGSRFWLKFAAAAEAATIYSSITADASPTYASSRHEPDRLCMSTRPSMLGRVGLAVL